MSSRTSLVGIALVSLAFATSGCGGSPAKAPADVAAHVSTIDACSRSKRRSVVASQLRASAAWSSTPGTRCRFA